MNAKELNQVPAGFLTLSEDYKIVNANQTLLKMIQYKQENVTGQVITFILANSSRGFFQFYFYPLITEKRQIDEMYIELKSQQGETVPVLFYASQQPNGDISCVVVPINKRNKFEDELIASKKIAEDRLEEKNELNEALRLTLKNLKDKQNELLKVNYQIQQELQLAKKIQETSLTEAFDNQHIQIEAYYNASKELSGDIYGFYQINEKQYGIILLDVMGHGISSSLITMSLEGLFQRLISRGVSTSELMQILDDHLHSFFENNEEAWHYCTAIYLFIDIEKQTVEYINAGHPAAIYQDLNGEQIELQTITPPLGTFRGIHFKATEFSYSKGSRILLYTDGVSEPLEEGRLNIFVKENVSNSINTFKDKLLNLVDKEGNEHYKNDDQCFIIIDLKS